MMPRAETLPWTQVQSKSEQLRRGIEEIGRLLRTLATGEGDDAITGTAILTAELKAWEEAASPVLTQARELLARLTKERDEQVKTFSQRLKRELGRRGRTVHGDGSPLIVDGIVHVEEAFDEQTVRVNGESVTELACEAVADRVETEAERLRKLLTPNERFLEQMLNAYDQEIKATEREPGAQVETGTIHYRVALLRQTAAFRRNPTAKAFREYPREQFRAELYTALQGGNLTVKGKRLRHASGSDTSGSVFMLVPTLGRAAHVGRVWFEPAGD